MKILPVTICKQADKPEPLFWSEVPPVSTRDINWTLRHMEHSSSGLLEQFSGLYQVTLRRESMPGG